MKAILITMVVVTGLILIGAIKDVSPFNIVESLPFLGGEKPGVFHLGGIIMILITLNGLRKLRRAPSKTSGGYPLYDETPSDSQDADDHAPPAAP
jgi:hypothetical protein